MAHEEHAPTEPVSGQLATGLLGHVTRELRTRLASATAAVEGLRDPTVSWTDEERSELLGVAQGSLEEVAVLVRELSAVGARMGTPTRPSAQGSSLRDLLVAAVADLGQGAPRPRTRIPAALPPVLGDPLLLRLVLVSLLRHALRAADTPVPDVRAVCRGPRVLIRIASRAPAAGRWSSRVRTPAPPIPWDRDAALGPDLTVARGLAQLIGATLHAGEEGVEASTVLELPAGPAPAAPDGRLTGR